MYIILKCKFIMSQTKLKIKTEMSTANRID